MLPWVLPQPWNNPLDGCNEESEKNREDGENTSSTACTRAGSSVCALHNLLGNSLPSQGRPVNVAVFTVRLQGLTGKVDAPH